MDVPPKQSETAAEAQADDTAATTAATRDASATVTATPDNADDPATMLQAAFPALDKAIITEVLAAHGGNADAASMALLEMSDNTGTRNSSDHSVARNAQLVSDEAYARELMAQMEREHQEAYGRPLGTPPQDDRNATNNTTTTNEIDYSALNYVPRQRSRPGQTTGPSTTMHLPGYSGNSQESRGQGRDELDQLAEQFNKFADTGKKTLTSLMSKAKDKYAQVQQQQQQQQQQQRGSSQGTSQTDARGLASGPITIGKFTLPSIPAPWQNNSNNSTNPPARPMSPRDAVRAESPGMRESLMPDYSRSPPPPSSALRNSSDLHATPTQPIRMNNSGATASEGGFGRSPNLGMATATSATAAYSSSPSGLTKVSSNTMGSSPAKVQMLPRQTISLLDTPKDASSPTAIPASATGTGGQPSQPQASATSLLQQQQPKSRSRNAQDSDEESDVEYVRNPFNDDD